jgi:hypothetical protein
MYALDLWHRRNLRTPTKAEWTRAGHDHPCYVTVVAVFGSWNAAIRAAGFRQRKRGEPRGGVRPRRWDRAAISRAIVEWDERHGRPPKKAEWTAGGESHPCSTTVTHSFGTWNNALRASGLKPRTPADHARAHLTLPARCPRTGRFVDELPKLSF